LVARVKKTVRERLLDRSFSSSPPVKSDGTCLSFNGRPHIITSWHKLDYRKYHKIHQRGKIRKTAYTLSSPTIIEDDQISVPSKGWAEMIRKVYEMDPLLYPSCGGRMSIISFIDDHNVIDRIIRHLELTFEAERPPPPRVVQQDLLMAAKESREYF
jgi:hypothetical protein